MTFVSWIERTTQYSNFVFSFIQVISLFFHYLKLDIYKKLIDLINYLKKKNRTEEIFFLMGADNLISFHRWHKWKIISSKCSILVFDRINYKSKSLKSTAFKKLSGKGLKFIKYKKVNISSSKLRKI